MRRPDGGSPTFPDDCWQAEQPEKACDEANDIVIDGQQAKAGFEESF